MIVLPHGGCQRARQVVAQVLQGALASDVRLHSNSYMLSFAQAPQTTCASLPTPFLPPADQHGPSTHPPEMPGSGMCL